MTTRSPPSPTAALLLATAMAAASPCPAAAGDAFSGFGGRWTGSGSVLMADGSREALRCRADNAASPDALHLDVLCASDSYRVDVVADVRARGNAFSGSWQETTRGIGGEVTGTVPRAGQMQASLHTLGGGMELGATTDGRRQAIALRSQGTEIEGAEIRLRRP